MIRSTKLKTKRQEKNLSVSEVSESANISKSYWYQLEKGNKSPSKKTMVKISKTLGIGIEELFFNEEV